MSSLFSVMQASGDRSALEASFSGRETTRDPNRARVLRWLFDQGTRPHARHALGRLHDRNVMEDVVTLLLQAPEVRRASEEKPTGAWPWTPPCARFSVGELEVDGATREVRVGGRALVLEPIERTLIEYLAVNESRVVTRVELLRRVWGGGRFRSRVVDAYVGRVRRKLEGSGVTIATIRGTGYRIVERSAEPTIGSIVAGVAESAGSLSTIW